MRYSAPILALAILAHLSSGCLGDRCGPGEVLQGGVCIELSVDSSTDLLADSQRDSSVDQRSDALGDYLVDTFADAGDAATGLGEPCSGDAECTGAADYCAIQPPATSGYCTFTGCDPQADTCPEGYVCFDLSRFDPKLPAFCMKKP